MSAEEQIRAAIQLIWRNLPDHPSTFADCGRGCGRASGRGGGPCLICAENDLSKAIGDADVAAAYVVACRDLRWTEEWMIEQADTKPPHLSTSDYEA